MNEALAKTLSRLCLPLLATLPLAGCVHTAAYPDQWENLSSRSTDNSCQALAGTYRDNGEDSYLSPDASLYDVLFGYDYGWNEPGKASYTRIHFDRPGRLTIAVYGQKGLLHQASYDASQGQYSCDKGAVVLKANGPIKQPLVFGRFHQTLSLESTPGHLVVQDHQSGTGVVVILPSITSSSTWFRFQRVDGNPATL